MFNLGIAACCCGMHPPPPITKMVIDVLYEVGVRHGRSRIFGGTIPSAEFTCPGNTLLTIEYDCDRTPGTGDEGTIEINQTPPQYLGQTQIMWECAFREEHSARPEAGVCTAEPGVIFLGAHPGWEVVEAEANMRYAGQFELPKTGQSDLFLSCAWKWFNGTAIVSSGINLTVKQVKEDYYNPACVKRSMVDHATPIGTCLDCCIEDGADETVAIGGTFWTPAIYRDGLMLTAYTIATTDTWTLTIGGGACTIKKNGAIAYTFSLASYTIEGLMSAINATAELIGSSSAAGASGGPVRSSPATLIPDQGPWTLTSAPAQGVWLRRPGDAWEQFQTCAQCRYAFTNWTTSEVTAWGAGVGTLAQFTEGFEVYIPETDEAMALAEIDSGSGADAAVTLGATSTLYGIPPVSHCFDPLFIPSTCTSGYGSCSGTGTGSNTKGIPGGAIGAGYYRPAAGNVTIYRRFDSLESPPDRTPCSGPPGGGGLWLFEYALCIGAYGPFCEAQVPHLCYGLTQGRAKELRFQFQCQRM